MAWVRHRVARRHPVTGRTALYAVSGSSFGIEGMPDDEAVDLLDELKRARHAGEVPAAPQVRRRRRGDLGQCLAAAFGDADRSARIRARCGASPSRRRGNMMRRLLSRGRHRGVCACRQRAGANAARRVAVQRRPCVHQGAGAVRGAGEEVLRQERSTSCCTRTASSAWRSSTSSTWRRARRWTTPSCRRRTCRPSPRRRRSSTRRSCSATSRTGTRCSTPTC